MEKINSQKYLLDNNCDDLILNDRTWTKVKDRIYSSDIMMQFAKDYHETELKKFRKRKYRHSLPPNETKTNRI